MAKAITETEYVDAANSHLGWCHVCEDFTREMIEPDAANYGCPNCNQRSVYGAELALISGLIDFGEDKNGS